MLVAHGDPSRSSRIDWEQASHYRIDTEFKQKFPMDGPIDYGRLRAAQSYYASVREYFWIDDREIFSNLIKAFISGSGMALEASLSFFGDFEGKLRKGVPRIAKEIYGQESGQKMDEIRKSLDIKNNIGSIVLGDLAKIYEKFVIEAHIIETSPFSDEAISRVLRDLPIWRNRVAHEGAKMDDFDEVFALLRRCVPIYYRLIEKIDFLLQSKENS